MQCSLCISCSAMQQCVPSTNAVLVQVPKPAPLLVTDPVHGHLQAAATQQQRRLQGGPGGPLQTLPQQCSRVQGTLEGQVESLPPFSLSIMLTCFVSDMTMTMSMVITTMTAARRATAEAARVTAVAAIVAVILILLKRGCVQGMWCLEDWSPGWREIEYFFVPYLTIKVCEKQKLANLVT